MKHRILTNTFRSIRRSYPLFLSLLIMSALGVFVFAGLTATAPDMLSALDRHLDATHVYDLRLISDMGLTDEDLTEIRTLPMIEAAEGAATKDTLVTWQNDEFETTFVVNSLPESLNQIKLSSGRLPEASDEILVEPNFLTRNDLALGDTITLKAEGFVASEVTIVGTAASNMYFNNTKLEQSRGNTSIGFGKIGYYAFLLPEAFDQDYHTVIYMAVAGCETLETGSAAYQARIEEATEALKTLGPVREQARYDALYEDAVTEIEDARAEADQELADAREELEDADQKLQDGASELADARKELKKAKRKLAKGRKELDDAAEELASHEAELADAKDTLDSSYETLTAKDAELADAEATLQAAEKELTKNKKAAAAADKQLTKAKKTLDQAKKELDASRLQLDEGWTLLNTALVSNGLTIETLEQMAPFMPELTPFMTQLTALNEGEAAYKTGLAAYQSGLAEYKTNKKAYQQGLTALTAAEAEYQAGVEAFEAGKEQLQAGWDAYYEGLAQYEEGREALTTARSDYEQGEQDYAEALQKYKDGRADYLAGKKEYEENLQTYEDGLKEYEDAVAEADQAVADAYQELEDELKYPTWYYYDRSDYTTYTEYLDDAGSISNLSTVFPVVFFLVAILVSLITMNRLVEDDRLEIGTLKSMGFSSGHIMTKYLWFSLSATLIGGALGAASGLYIIPTMINSIYGILFDVAKFHTLPQWPTTLLGFFISVICVCGTSMWTVRKVLKEKPSELMRPKAPKNGKRVLLERITFLWKRMAFSQKVTVRNLFRYKKRVIVTVGGIAGCTALMLTGWGVRDSVVDIPTTQYDEIYRFDGYLVTKEIEPAQLEEILSEPEITGYTESERLNATLGDHDCTIFVVEDSEDLLNIGAFVDHETGEPVELRDDEVILSEKLAAMTGYGVGDEITVLDVDQNSYTYPVSYVTTNYIEHFVFMTRATFEKTRPYVTNMTYYYTAGHEVSDSLKERLLENEEILLLTDRATLLDNVANTLKSLNQVVLILIVLSGILSFVVLYNLSNININERRREIATLKVLGFYDKEVDRYITKENLWLTLLGILIGLVLGYFLSHIVVATVEIERCRFINWIKWPSYVISAVFSGCFTWIVNRITHFKLKKIDMIDSLKSVE